MAYRRRKQKREEGLLEVTVLGRRTRAPTAQANHAVLITPNHSTHADAYSIYAAADVIGVPVYMMTAWQVFADKSLAWPPGAALARVLQRRS